MSTLSFYKYPLFCVVFLALVSCNTPKPSNSLTTPIQETITLSTGEWPPYMSESLPHYGISAQIITAAFAKVDINVNYQWYSWNKALKLVENGDVDISGIWFHTQEREKKFLFSPPVTNARTVFFYHKDTNFNWLDFETFPKDYIVGVIKGYTHGPTFDKAVKKGKINTKVSNSHKQNIEKLIQRDITAFPADQQVTRVILNSLFSKEQINLLKTHPRPIINIPQYVITSKNNTKGINLIKKFSKGLNLLISSGEFDTIMNQYQ